MSPGEDGEGGVQTSDMGTVTFQYNLDILLGKNLYLENSNKSQHEAHQEKTLTNWTSDPDLHGEKNHGNPNFSLSMRVRIRKKESRDAHREERTCALSASLSASLETGSGDS